MTVEHEHGLGWIAKPDPRNANFPMEKELTERAFTATDALGVGREWRLAKGRVDQGPTPRCVGYAGWNWQLTSPVMDVLLSSVTGDMLYAACKQVDGFPDEDGSTTNALMAVLRDRFRLIRKWTWATDVRTAAAWVLARGPLFVGSDWRTGMDDPAPDGTIRYEGSVRGGHEYLLVGYDAGRRAFKLLNSWGAHWGLDGTAWLPDGDLAAILADGGEAAGAMEIPARDR